MTVTYHGGLNPGDPPSGALSSTGYNPVNPFIIALVLIALGTIGLLLVRRRA